MQISLTIQEACAESGIGRTSLYAAINDGLLPAKKFGRKTIILRQDLEAFLAALPSYQTQES